MVVLAALTLPAFARAEVELDPATDTVRVAARLDGGTLTPPAPGAAATIGLRYVREHRASLGLTAADLETLGDPTVETFAGIRQVRWPQAVDGIEVADAELRVNVTDDGRVLSVLGSPSSDLPADTTPRLPKPAPDASLTIYDDRLAYRHEEAVSDRAVYDVITDADSGRVLRKTNLVKALDASVWDLHPSKVVPARPFDIGPWLGRTDRLESQWMHVYSDTDFDDVADPAEEVVPKAYEPAWPTGTGCSDAKPCTWDGSDRGANRERVAVQAFYLANRFREHLAGAPFGFDFQADQLLLETSDGPGTNNANMYTPPVGKAPRMQMFLWSGNGYRSINSGDDASVLFHEYAHGLTGRLITFADGVGALSSWQAGAMGEGWSDFFAKDFTVTKGWEPDTGAPGQVHMGVYSDATKNQIRSSALDCPAGSAGDCPGYTYGDFAEIADGPEVHYDGEIWAQTLWDLRGALPPGKALPLIAAALRLTPPEPSFLDARNAILAADAAAGGTYHDQIWGVFADRGMGFYASTTDGADLAPVEDTSPPPAAGAPRGSLTGTVRDAAGAPVAGITVSVGGLETGPDALKTTTRADGTYTLEAPVRTYTSIVASAPGYERAVVEDVPVPGVADATVRRNWALGATLQSTAGSENADMGCGPKQAFDGLPGSTWSTRQAGGDKELVLELPEAIDITGFGVDPGAGCGDFEDSATAMFEISTGPTAAGPWTPQVTQTLGPAHRHVMTRFAKSVANARYVRMLPMSTQTPGATYIDLSELAVYGVPAGVRLVSTPPAVTRERTATFAFAGGTGYECTWDGGVAEPCSSPASKVLGEGPHTFSLRAADDPTPVTHAWTIDTVAPATAISGAAVSDRTATFTFASSDATAVTHACTLDGATAPCASPQTYTGLADGTHAFSVVATDAAGNTATASRSVTVDATPPETTITWGPPPILTTRDFTFAFGASRAETFTCALDGAAPRPCTSPLALTGLAEGAHSLVVTAFDAKGRPDPTPARSDFTVVIPNRPPAPGPTATPTPPVPNTAALTSASAARTVSRRTGRVTVKLRGASGAKVALRAKVGARVAGRATKTLRGASVSVRLTLDKRRLKVGATVTVRVQATGPGLTPITRTLRIRVKA